jgi:two-component system chemotaxis response regulator CheV
MIEDNKYDLQDDELVKLVSSNANTSSQYVIFTNALDELYGINVAKVEELIMNKEISITRDAQKKDSNSLGVSKIRDNIVTMLNFDDWLGTPEYQDDDLRLIILTNYSNVRLGLIIKSVVGIQSFDADTFDKNERDEKTIFIVETSINGEKRLCKIFDSDRLIMDVFPQAEQNHKDSVKQIDKSDNIKHTNKLILFAEDSILIQKHIVNLLENFDYKYEVFENGKGLLDRLGEINNDDIGIIITDVEMPVMDGMTLMKEIKNSPEYSQIPVVVNTNMANNAIVSNSLELGAKEVIKKLDMQALFNAIKQYAR